MNFTLITALLCSFSLISVCVCEFYTVEVQPGEDVTLMCSNFTSFISHITWFRLANTPNISCISSMSSAEANATYCDGFQNDKFNMTSITTILFLMIHHVDLSDSGLYFCGCYKDKKTVIDSATFLKVQEPVITIRDLMSLILGAVIIFLITVIIGLVVKIRKMYTARIKGSNLQNHENLDSDALNYAALSFHPRAKGSRRPATGNQLEPNVVYAATR